MYSGVIGVKRSPRQLLPAINSWAKIKLPTADYFSTWQFDLYNKSDGNQSEIQRTRLPKLHSLTKLIVARKLVSMDDSGQHAIEGMLCVTRKIRPGDEACLLCYSPDVHKQVLLLLLLLLCLPAAASFYIVHGVPGCSDCSCCLKCMHVLVETSIYVACFPTETSAHMCFILTYLLSSKLLGWK